MKIVWENLIAYKSDQKKSFEQLCYQLAVEKFGAKGMTPIDDSGGGDGVEFFLTQPNGEVWGWQAKFFSRLDEGGRKEQIKSSLQRAVKNHPTLVKWFLCNKTNLTPNENKWFHSTLPHTIKRGNRVIPQDRKIELVHWGESKILNFLRLHQDIHRYFFSAKLLSWDWFLDKYKRVSQASQIQAKYQSDLHVHTQADDNTIKILGGVDLANYLRDEMENNQVQMYAEEYEAALKRLHAEDVPPEFLNIQDEFRKITQDKFLTIHNGINKLEELADLLTQEDDIVLKTKIKEFGNYLEELRTYYTRNKELSESSLCSPLSHIQSNQPHSDYFRIPENGTIWQRLQNWFLGLFRKQGNTSTTKSQVLPQRESRETIAENNKRRAVRDVIFGPYYALGEYAIRSLEQSFRSFELIDQKELHISGEAGMGKTHVAFSVYEKRIQQNLPALFLSAKDFINRNSPSRQIIENGTLDIPNDWSFSDFLGALDVAGSIYKTKVPIIVDGLNESRHWQDVWADGLEQFALSIKKYSWLVLITTYRASYEESLFPDLYFKKPDSWKIMGAVYGFQDLTWEAIEKYFAYYKIKLKSNSNALEEFWNPLYLKIFCETKNPVRMNEVRVSFQNQDLFEVFDEYLQKCDKEITYHLPDLDPKYHKGFVHKKLAEIAQRMWMSNSRSIQYQDDLLNSTELSLFESLNLLIFRDWNNEQEEISFTYDLMGGYLIAKYLINNPPSNLLGSIHQLFSFKDPLIKYFVKSKTFKIRLLHGDHLHPHHSDILRCFSILLIKTNNTYLYELRSDPVSCQIAVESLFEINLVYIQNKESSVRNFIRQEFSNDKKRNRLFQLSEKVDLDNSHPLSFNLWSDLLMSLDIVNRDLTWGEYMRLNSPRYGYAYFFSLVDSFIINCKEGVISNEKLHLTAKKVMWLLTTNIRILRDKATHALYWYSRKHPGNFMTLLGYSLEINDPYVSERMLAASYGLAMARQNDPDFREQTLSEYASFLFESIFQDQARFKTTHVLARDYAKRTIDIALLHHPNLLSVEQKKLIEYPFVNYEAWTWGKSHDRDKGNYRDGNAPIHMDFGNYTIGRLINSRRPYDSNHPEYRSTLAGIYWRIYDLGYSLEKFSKIDARIASDNWRSDTENEIGPIDRYGKKYSWIAFYEMAGYRSDIGHLNDRGGKPIVRISDINIDPSFPVELKHFDLIQALGESNYLGKPNQDAIKWCNDDQDIMVEKYLVGEFPFDNNQSDWVLLKSIISQKDSEDPKRDIHITTNALLLSQGEYDKVLSLIEKSHRYEFSYLDPVQDYYIYEGEIPWSELMPDDYHEWIDFKYSTAKETGKLDDPRDATIEAESTVFKNGWESTHSTINPPGNTVTPSKLIANYLGLSIIPQSSDLVDKYGNLVSTTFCINRGVNKGTTFTYIRKESIRKYMLEKDQRILFFQWTEKRYFPNRISGISRDLGETTYRTICKIITVPF